MQNRLEPLTLAGVIHDLNNVFETLFEGVDLLREDPKYAKLAGTMKRSLKHGARIVKSLEEKGGLTEVDRLLEQAVALLTDYQTATRGPAIEVVVKMEAGLQIRGMRGAWERVFLNLFLNAARMMPEGGKIHVEVGQGKDGIVFLVRDEGPGIPARVLPKLFEPGVTTAAKHKGLGLHIVKSIVESVGGRVSARNCETGTGAEFRIDLPADYKPTIGTKFHIAAD
jgi:signal transduction histidine kinase